MRVPGSRNPKSGAYVRFERLIGLDRQRRVYTYSLQQLGESLGVYGPEMRPTKTGRRNPNFRGHVHRWYQTYIALNQLRQLRGGAFSDGCRHWACYILALVQTKIGTKAADVERDGLNLAKQCRPPLNESEALDSIRSGIRAKRNSSESRRL